MLSPVEFSCLKTRKFWPCPWSLIYSTIEIIIKKYAWQSFIICLCLALSRSLCSFSLREKPLCYLCRMLQNAECCRMQNIDNKGFVATPLKKTKQMVIVVPRSSIANKSTWRMVWMPERSTCWNHSENDKPLQPLNWSPKSDVFIILRQVKPGYPNCSVAKYMTCK